MIHIKEYTGIEDARQEVYFFTKRHGGILSKMDGVEWRGCHRLYWEHLSHDIMFAEIWQRIKKFL